MKNFGKINLFVAGWIAILLSMSHQNAIADDFAIAMYACRLTKEKWEQSVLPGANYSDATLAVVAASWSALSFFNNKLSWEMEAQVGRYFGDQNHWEFNLPILGFRWHQFPWNNHVATSIAWGIGPSYATSIPEIELETNDSTSHWLVYWYAELALGLPKVSWEILLRLHHRSNGFGTVSEDGGSNAVGAGVRYRF